MRQPLAICLSQDKSFTNLCELCGLHLGIECLSFTDTHAVIQSIHTHPPDILISDIDTLNALTPTRTSCQPQPAWLLRLPPKSGWALAGELTRCYKINEILPPPLSASNIYEALREFLEFPAPASWLGSNARLAQTMWLNAECSPHAPKIPPIARDLSCGNFIHAHFLSVFCRIIFSKASGQLHIHRPAMHWILHANAGFPCAMDTRDSESLFGFETWLERHKNDANLEERLPSARALYQKKTPPSYANAPHRLFERKRTWLSLLIAEIFTWPNARFRFSPTSPASSQNNAPLFSEHDLDDIIKNAAFQNVWDAAILDATQTSLPFLLKLHDKNQWFARAELSRHAAIVAQKLKNSTTLTEMLALLPPQCPVQRTLYLAMMMDEITMTP